MSEIAALIENDRSNPARCYFHGQTPLGGSDVCRPELTDDGSILLRSINLNHTVYRVTEDEYRELRKSPQRKVGMWDFVSEDDEDADRIASATRDPQYAGRRIGDLERTLAAKDAEIERLKDLNADAHGIVARIWSILGNPSYEELNGRTIYDLVQQQRDALEPFAKVAENDIGEDETDQDIFRPMDRHNRAPRITVGDLRAASAALAGGSHG